MKRVLKNVLLACLLPVAGVAAAQVPTLPDPVAYKCYLCTPGEMRDVALAQGPGVQYVYDLDVPAITGFTVSVSGGVLTAVPLDPEAWIKQQFAAIAQHFISTGDLSILLKNVDIFASGSDHGRSQTMPYIRGHHLSALHPDHVIEREKVSRYLQRRQPAYLRTDDPAGRLLRLDHMQNNPVTAIVRFDDDEPGEAGYIFDYGTRTWVYLYATDGDLLGAPIQERAEDFLVGPYPESWPGNHMFVKSRGWYLDAFISRAEWAGIPVGGSRPTGSSIIDVLCSRDDSQRIECAFR